MKTQIYFTHQTDIPFESHENIRQLLDHAVKETLAYKDWWGLESIGCMIIAVDLENASDVLKKYYKPRRHWFKQTYIEKNPLHGDRTYHGYAVFEHAISQQAYRAMVTSLPERYELLGEDLAVMIEKMKYLEKKVPEFDFAEFKRVFLEAIYSKIN